MLTLKEASAVLGISIPALKKQIYQGKHKAHKAKGYKDKDVWMLDIPNHHINTLMPEWLDDLRAGKGYDKPYAKSTVRNYRSFIQMMWKHADTEPSFHAFNLATLKMAIDALSEMPTCHYALKRNIIDAFKCFTKWLIARELKPKSSLEGIEDLRPKRFTPAKRDKLKQGDISRLLEAVDKHCTLPFFKERMHLLLTLLLTTGLRISEALAIRLEHINYEQGTILVLGKGNKPRITVLSESLQKVIEKWVHTFHAQGQTLFNNLAYSGALIALKRLKKHLLFPVGFHALRRTCATQWVQMNVPITMVSKLLGHTSLKTTQLYVEADAHDAVRFVRALPSYF
ncbi:MAG: site-specific integrase [Vampirovibrio sp.]